MTGELRIELLVCTDERILSVNLSVRPVMDQTREAVCEEPTDLKSSFV